MTDKKISQLSAASTPLAGTEVLPIVQSSATVKVATDDLTVKNVRSNATSGILQVAGPAAAATRVMTVPDANFTAARTDAANSFSSDQTLADGNLVIGTAGKGIDFSVTTDAAGMTSELLDDYEEGTWTPTYQPATGSFTSITYSNTGGVYTKIGNICIVSGYIATSALDTTGGSGAVRVGGLPYGIAGSSGGTRDAWRGGSIGYSAGWSGERPSSVFASGGSSTFALMYRTNATSDSAYVDVSDMDTSGANEIAFALVYKV